MPSDISDEYRKVMIEGLEELSRLAHLPKLGEVLVCVINEIKILDAQVTELQQTNRTLHNLLSEMSEVRDSEIGGKLH